MHTFLRSTPDTAWLRFASGARFVISLPQTYVVTLKATLQRTSRSKESGAAGVVTVSVDGREILLVLEGVHIHVVTLHPASGCFQCDSSVGVHGGLEKFAGPEIPKQHESDTCSNCQDVAFEGDRANTTARIPGRNFPHRLESSGIE